MRIEFESFQYNDDDIKEFVEKFGESVKFYLKPVVIKNFRLGFNNKQQLVFTFDSPNYKYLDISYNGWISDPSGKCYYMDIDAPSFEEDALEDHYIVPPCVKIKFYYGGREQDIVLGKMIALPLGYSYECAIVPYCDMQPEPENLLLDVEEIESTNDLMDVFDIDFKEIESCIKK